MELEQVGAPKVSSEKAQLFLSMMESNGYQFTPIIKPKSRRSKEHLETEKEYTDRIKAVVRDVIRLAHVSSVYDDVYLILSKSTIEEKVKWNVVEDLLNDEGIRLRTKLKIRAYAPPKKTA